MVNERDENTKPATDHPLDGCTGGGNPYRRSAIVAGFSKDPALSADLLISSDPSVRIVSLGALDRAGKLTIPLIVGSLTDPEWRVRRRACELAGRRARTVSTAGTEQNSSLTEALVNSLRDEEPLVAECAAWALGELIPVSSAEHETSEVVVALSTMATGHRDPLCREAAVAALGAIGEPTSLDAVLQALSDKPPIRRRATVALAAFEDERAESALRECLTDKDWQVRQAAEDLLERFDDDSSQ